MDARTQADRQRGGAADGRAWREDPGRFLNRELSTLDFNERVLELAADASVPTLERVRFCAIVSNALDEIFMVRVAGLLEQAETGLSPRSADGRLPDDVLREIHARVQTLVAHQARLWEDELRPTLEEAGRRVTALRLCNDDDQATLERYFEEEIFPMLTPLAVGPGQPFP